MEKPPSSRREPRSLEQAEKEMTEGIHFDLGSLDMGGKLEVETKNTTYLIEKHEDGLYISGNPKYCPKPTKIRGIGSTLGGSAIFNERILIDGYLEYSLEGRDKPVTTSQIQDFVELN
jgi:hypothetical protein